MNSELNTVWQKYVKLVLADFILITFKDITYEEKEYFLELLMNDKIKNSNFIFTVITKIEILDFIYSKLEKDKAMAVIKTLHYLLKNILTSRLIVESIIKQ